MQPRLLQLEGDAGAPLDADGRPPLQRRPGAHRRRARARARGGGAAARRACPAPHEVFGVCGAACLLRRQLFTELGGYDESYFAFYEDVDLNVRARIAGWRFAYVPAAVVWHVGNASWLAGFERPGADNARLVARNRLATQVKFMPARRRSPDRRGRGSAPSPAPPPSAACAPTLAGKLAALRWLPAPAARAPPPAPRGRPGPRPPLARRLARPSVDLTAPIVRGHTLDK